MTWVCHHRNYQVSSSTRIHGNKTAQGRLYHTRRGLTQSVAPPEGFSVRAQDLGFGRLFDNIRDAVIVAEAGTGRGVLWNAAATDFFGYSLPEALAALSVAALVPGYPKARPQVVRVHHPETAHRRYIDSHEVLD